MERVDPGAARSVRHAGCRVVRVVRAVRDVRGARREHATDVREREISVLEY